MIFLGDIGVASFQTWVTWVNCMVKWMGECFLWAWLAPLQKIIISCYALVISHLLCIYLSGLLPTPQAQVGGMGYESGKITHVPPL